MACTSKAWRMIKTAIVVIIFGSLFLMPVALIAVIIDTIKKAEPDFDID